MNRKNKTFSGKNKKRVYGITSLILTVVVIALVVVGNGLLYKLGWRIDMTEEKVYTVSDEADEIFSKLGSRDIEIIFFTPFDEMKNNRQQNMVYEYCLSLEKKYDYISLKYIDSLAHPEEVKQYQSTTVPDIDLDDVVISNGSAYRKCAIEWFFNFDKDSNEMVGFYAEYRIASSIMQLSYDERTVLFTTGHGEKTQGTEAYSLLENAGFTCREIDLSKEDIPETTRLLIINDPIYDFKGIESESNELSKLDRYLDKQGNMMIFESPETASNLNNLSELLSEWGIEFVSNAKIRDDNNSISADGYSLVSEYATDKSKPGAAFCSKILNDGKSPNTVVSNAMPIKLLFDSRNMITTGTVLYSKDTAKAFSTKDGSLVDSGAMSLMTVSVKQTISAENNETYYNYVIAVGSNRFTDDTYIGGQRYGNRDIFYECIRQFGNEVVPVDLDLRWLDENTLDVTVEQARVWTLILVTFLPSAAAVICVTVYIRRKHR